MAFREMKGAAVGIQRMARGFLVRIDVAKQHLVLSFSLLLALSSSSQTSLSLLFAL